jgi:trehalose-6-phosphate synthase
MPEAQRRSLHDAAAQVVRTNDVRKWLEAQLTDLEPILAESDAAARQHDR